MNALSVWLSKIREQTAIARFEGTAPAVCKPDAAYWIGPMRELLDRVYRPLNRTHVTVTTKRTFR
jgi:hypothetical protein